MTKMPRPFSIYLDLVRFIAACLVYLYHSNQRWLVEPILPWSNHGHSSVIVFFVLSGYVIAYITATKEGDWRTYAASRLSRVYSVAIPALALTLVLDWAARHLLPGPNTYPFDWFAVRIASSMLLLNEVWFVSITSFSNVPYWSICYESWYYVGFGLLTFLPSNRAWIWLAFLALLLGPKILLLAPIWAMGVWLFRSQGLARMSESAGWLLVASTVAAIAAFIALDIEHAVAARFEAIVGKQWFEQLTFSRFFISDYLLGALVTLHFAGMRRVADRLQGLLLPIERPVKAVAAYTFTLYLLHQPLFLFWGSVLNRDPKGFGAWAMTTCFVAVSVAVVGACTENRRHLFTRWIRARLAAIPGDRRDAQQRA